MEELKIKKARQVVGKTLSFTNADEDDSEFILSLRLDQKLSRHLSVTAPDLQAQKEWMRRYNSSDDGEAYFIIRHASQRVGTVRLYDARGISFCWGSWILSKTAPQMAAIESALMVYSYAMSFLGFKRSHFDVRKDNERVWQFHERFGARRVREEGLDFFYEIEGKQVQASRQKFIRYLPADVDVQF